MHRTLQRLVLLGVLATVVVIGGLSQGPAGAQTTSTTNTTVASSTASSTTTAPSSTTSTTSTTAAPTPSTTSTTSTTTVPTAPQKATFTYPVDKAPEVDLDKPFTWTSAGGAQNYYLYVGSSLGAKDLLDSGALATSRTSYKVPPLPTGKMLFARIWTKAGDRWLYSDISFTPLPKAYFTHPKDRAADVDLDQPFTWSSATGVDGYYLYVGTTAGAADLVNSGVITRTSYRVPALPTGKTAYARIWTKVGDRWLYSDISFTVRAKASFTYPTDAAADVDSDRPFAWSSVAGADGYYLYVGTAVGTADLVNTGLIGQTSYTVPPLPAGKTLYARIWTKLGDRWLYSDVAFTAVAKAYFLHPRNNASEVDTDTPFSWTSVPGADGYYLYVGTAAGNADLVNTGVITQTSYRVPPLPRGRTLYARIWTRVGGRWLYSDISFTALGKAVLTYPSANATDVDTGKPFTWTSVSGADGYYLYVGTAAGTADLVDTGVIAETSYRVPPLPTATPLYARIWTKLGDRWLYSDTSFVVAVNRAALSYPRHGEVLSNPDRAFTWEPVPGALGYTLHVGTAPGAKDLFDTFEIQRTSAAVPPLPTGQDLFARLWTRNATGWSSTDVTFRAAYATAALMFPLNGAANVDTAMPFRWTPGTTATAYRLTVGTAAGSNDLVDSGETARTSWEVGALPVNTPLWARISTKTVSGWVWREVQFQAALRFSHPATGAVNVDPGVPFRWPTVAGAGSYLLTVGSTPGGDDLFSSGPVTQTSISVPASALPEGRTLYARVRADLADGTARQADAAFAVGSPSAAAHIVAPADGATDVDASDPFVWSQVDLADAYRLQIEAGGVIQRDSGEIQVPRWFAHDLSPGEYQGRLGTRVNGEWRHTQFRFTVARSGGSAAKELASAHWAVHFVRSMADAKGYPYAWTPLYRTVVTDGNHVQAFCGEYSRTLLSVLAQMNVAARLPADRRPRILNVAFNANNFDTHVLVEFYDSDTGTWTLLDPTFDMTMQRSSDGRWASKEDVRQATLEKRWGDIRYVFLGESGDAHARAYYLDYPLLYLNVAPLPALGGGADPRPYMTRLATLPQGQPGVYAVSSTQTSVTLVVDGVTREVATDGAYGLSVIFNAHTISLPSGSAETVVAYRPNRYVF